MRIVPYIALLNSRMIGPTPSASEVANSCPVIRKPPSPTKADDEPIGMDELGADRGRNPVAHRAAGRAELASRAAVLQKAVGPAAEIAGVAGDDRVVGQTVAQPAHDLAEIEHAAAGRGRGLEPRLVLGAHRRPPAATSAAGTGSNAAAAAANSGMPDWIARVGRKTRPSSSAAGWTWISILPGSGMPSSE